MGDFSMPGVTGGDKGAHCCKEKGGSENKDGAEFEGAVGDAKSREAEGNDDAKGTYRTVASNPRDIKAAYQERQEIREGLQDLDAELFELEQSGEVSHKDLKGIKEQYQALKERADNLPESSLDTTSLRRQVQEVLPSDNNPFGTKFEQIDARMDRLESVANGEDVPDRVPDGAIRVDHHYSRADDTLMDTSMVPIGKDADGYEQFVAFSPTEQTKPGSYYRDEAGNFTANRNEAVKEFDGVAMDPSILPDNAILDDKGNYWRPAGADKDGTQTFQPLRSGDNQFSYGAAVRTYYQDADGNFSHKKSDESVSAKDFEKSQWEPKLPEGAVAVNADGDGKIDFHMVSIGADEGGQERFVAVQQDYSANRPDQQIYVRNEDGGFETLDGEPMEALERPDFTRLLGMPIAFSNVPVAKNGVAEETS